MTINVRPQVNDRTGTEEDVAAVRQVVADIETAFNTNDAVLMNAHFAADATATNAVGQRVRGIEALDDAARSGLDGFLRDQYVRYEIADVSFPRPDTAIVHKLATATDEHGAPIAVGHEMIAMYVLVKEAGRWWIAARANTLVPRPD
ncbi:SgcJ/EcaC family oxidoreductase [Solicola gregarius]|uniref:SgcJ/EcaC family oxidoreductase n=1 Tax=Solicola gregarius TaxID=2908642 RepID=A0AA46TK73_9ACTN|nr:SgcJ/EcaC family oxidoreductase [Solicola gregarius]UYM06392.1 SgcJ/EcaC family oxidoreductase [Solicola gregarius]